MKTRRLSAELFEELQRLATYQEHKEIIDLLFNRLTVDEQAVIVQDLTQRQYQNELVRLRFGKGEE